MDRKSQLFIQNKLLNNYLNQFASMVGLLKILEYRNHTKKYLKM